MIQKYLKVGLGKADSEIDWQEVGVEALTILLIPCIWIVGLILSVFLAYVVIGALHVGRLLAYLVYALLLPVMSRLNLSQETQDKVYLGIHCVCCPLCSALTVSTLWR